MKWSAILSAYLTVSYAQLERVTDFVSPVSLISEFTVTSESTIYTGSTEDSSFYVNLLDAGLEKKTSGKPKIFLKKLIKPDVFIATSEEPVTLELPKVTEEFTEDKRDSPLQTSAELSSQTVETNETPITNRFSLYDETRNYTNTEKLLISNQIDDNILEESKTIRSSLTTSGIGQQYLNQPLTEDGNKHQIEKTTTTPREITNIQFNFLSSTVKPFFTLIPKSRYLYTSSPNVQSSKLTTAPLTVTTHSPVSNHFTAAFTSSINQGSTLSSYAPSVKSSSDRNAKIIYQDNIINSDGSYRNSFESSNGISIQAEGISRTYDGNPHTRTIVASGAFSWLDPYGKKVEVKYTADENGYRPQSDAIPTPPPTPPEIARALAWIRKVLAERKTK